MKAKSSVLIILGVALVVGIVSALKFGDNPVEEAANAIINEQLGTDIDISDILEGKKEKEDELKGVSATREGKMDYRGE